MSTYSQLRQIIPPDQALANKGLQAALEQVKNIRDGVLPEVATAVEGLESNVGLDDINALTGPLPANVTTFYTSTLAGGTGPDGLWLLTDLIGSITGTNITDSFASATVTLNTMSTEGDFTTLTNGTNGVYTVMENCIAGSYTVGNTDPGPPPTTDYTVVIPGGLPGAGTYGPANTASAAIQEAFTNGLQPAMISLVGTIVSNNPTQVANTTAYFNVICDQLQTEKNNLIDADIVFANLAPNTTPWSLVYNLASDGLDIVEGGTAYVLQSVANLSTQGGQAIVSTMRQARNQVRLDAAGLQTDITVSDEYPEPEANLGTTQYTVDQAVSQKII
jgi:hypothetical protein